MWFSWTLKSSIYHFICKKKKSMFLPSNKRFLCIICYKQTYFYTACEVSRSLVHTASKDYTHRVFLQSPCYSGSSTDPAVVYPACKWVGSVVTSFIQIKFKGSAASWISGSILVKHSTSKTDRLDGFLLAGLGVFNMNLSLLLQIFLERLKHEH